MRGIAIALALTLAPAVVEARGMYCTRHRAECQRRAAEREVRQIAAEKAEAERWAALTPKQREDELWKRLGLAAESEWRANEQLAAVERQRDENARQRDEMWTTTSLLVVVVILLFGAGFVLVATDDAGRESRRKT